MRNISMSNVSDVRVLMATTDRDTVSAWDQMLPRDIQPGWRLCWSPLGLGWKGYIETSERSFSVPTNHPNNRILG